MLFERAMMTISGCSLIYERRLPVALMISIGRVLKL
jgi:hypothetical protein